MKKLFAFALSLTLILFTIAACGDTATPMPTSEPIVIVVTATSVPTMISTTATPEPISTSTSTTTPDSTATSTPDEVSFGESVIEISEQLRDHIDGWVYLFTDGLPTDLSSVLSIDWQISVDIIALEVMIVADDARQLTPPWEFGEFYGLWLSGFEHYENAAQLIIGISWIVDPVDDIVSTIDQVASEILLGNDLMGEALEAIPSFP